MFIIRISTHFKILLVPKSPFSTNTWIKSGGQVFLKNKYKKFIDSLRITVAGGSGGNGYPKLQGLGGNGGNVCLVAKSGVKLLDVKKSNHSFRAEDGQHSSKFSIIARDGKDLEIQVPIGITVILDEYKREIAQLNKENDKITVAFGGRGGDKINAYCGTKGQKLAIRLDLKLLADVGLIGYPNAGKSTLLKALSRASPKIASYPFTTIQPNLGVIEYDPPKAVKLFDDCSKTKKDLPEYYEQDYRRITVADLPGLINGAHRNIGLGHKFLKHITQTHILIFVVDIDGFRNFSGKHYHESWSSCEPIDVIQSLINEIDLYDPMILRNKPSILAVSKLDTSEKRSKFLKLVERLKQIKITVPSIIEREKIITNCDMTLETDTQLINNNIDDNLDNENIEHQCSDGVFKFDKIIGISAFKKYNIDELKGMIRKLIDLKAELHRQGPMSFQQMLTEKNKSKQH